MAPNYAALLEAQNTPLVVKEISIEPPGPGEIVIKNSAIAINPVDYKMQDLGLFIKQYPAVLGSDVAGEVVEVGDGVKSFKKGDRAFGHAISLATGKPKDGAFQIYTHVNAVLAAHIPDNISYAQASVFPMAISTAASGLFQEHTLNLDLPSAPSTPSNGKVVLIWGGSGSVGCLAIQLAKSAGYTVFATASPRNHELVKSIGAAEVFDYKSDSVVDDIVKALEGKALAGIMDTISEGGTIEKNVEVAQRSNGVKNIAITLGWSGTAPEDIKVTPVFSISIKDNKVGPAVYGNYATKALETGGLVPKPNPEIFGKGIESLQKAVDMQREGVSAKKIVVEL